MKFELIENGPERLLRLKGEITAPDRREFDAVCDDALGGEAKKVVVDLSQLEFMDSAGLGFLLILLKQAEGKGASVVLSSPMGEVKEQLELARFHLLFEIVT